MTTDQATNHLADVIGEAQREAESDDRILRVGEDYFIYYDSDAESDDTQVWIVTVRPAVIVEA